ncbi:MAG: sodium:proton antiporter, partial [Sphingobacteriales bacterium]
MVRLTELCVIVSLIGTGLKINKSFTWRHWNIPLRLVSVTMILCIAAVAFFGWIGLGFSAAAAILLGAVLAPTDPVLAADVQVSPPDAKDRTDEEVKDDHVRFSLTAEAGLNDGMAFPFTWLAIQVAIATAAGTAWLWEWLWFDVLYRIGAAVGLGYLLGKGLAYLLFVIPRKT